MTNNIRSTYNCITFLESSGQFDQTIYRDNIWGYFDGGGSGGGDGGGGDGVSGGGGGAGGGDSSGGGVAVLVVEVS